MYSTVHVSTVKYSSVGLQYSKVRCNTVQFSTSSSAIIQCMCTSTKALAFVDIKRHLVLSYAVSINFCGPSSYLASVDFTHVVFGRRHLFVPPTRPCSAVFAPVLSSIRSTC